MLLHKSLVLATVLLLALANVAFASLVDHGSGCVAATSGDQWILTSDGRTFGIGSGTLIEEHATPLPLPVSQIKLWEFARWAYLVYMSDNVWILTGGDTGPWVNLGPPAGCTPIAVQPSTWTNVKTLFR